jgi:predicted MFS family arabinose efflux permease
MRSPNSTLVLVAVTASWTVAMLGFYAQPQLLGPIMRDLSLGEERVAWLFSFENIAFGITILAAAGPLARWSRVRAALIGGLLACVGHIASAFVGGFEELLFARLISAIGAGLASAAGTAAVASTRDPDRVFAIVTFTYGLLLAAEPAAIPYATVPFGARGGFLALAAACLVLLPLFGWLLPPRGTEEKTPSLRGAPHRTLAVIAMLGLLVYEVGQGGIWTFIEQLGLRSGLDEYAIGNALTGTGFAGLAGAGLAAWLGVRHGRRWPILIGIGLNVVAAAWIAIGVGPITYVLLNLLWNAAFYFVIPYLMGAMVALDDLGRWVVATNGIWMLGDGLAPGVAGSLVARAGYPSLAALPLLTGLVCVVVMLTVLHRIDAATPRRASAEVE